jgi:hypothetical protein
MQHNLAQLELNRMRAAEQVASETGRVAKRARLVREPGAKRQWAAATLARLAWRLDPKAALRAWP